MTSTSDSANRISLSGYLHARPEVSGAGAIRFRLVYSPSDDTYDEAVLPCVHFTTAEDCLDGMEAGTPVHVTGQLHIPGPSGRALLLVVTELNPPGADEEQLPEHAYIGDIRRYRDNYVLATYRAVRRTHPAVPAKIVTWHALWTLRGRRVSETTDADLLPYLISGFESDHGTH